MNQRISRERNMGRPVSTFGVVVATFVSGLMGGALVPGVAQALVDPQKTFLGKHTPSFLQVTPS